MKELKIKIPTKCPECNNKIKPYTNNNCNWTTEKEKR